MKILLAEDDADYRILIGRMLEKNGHEVSAHENGLSCRSVLEKEAFDLLITDLFMPVLDGMQLTLTIRSRDWNLPIIGITGGHANLMGPYISTMLSLGVDAVLEKPFSEKQLTDLIASVMERKEGCAA